VSVDVELRHLRSFVAVAEELNFTRAARKLFIAQQALSSQIRQLESRVDVQLLERNSRSVRLTPAGETLLAQARLLLAGADDAIAATRATGTGTTTLTVGFVAAVDHPAVSDALDRFVRERPDVEVHIRFGNLLDPAGGLRERSADVAFVYGPFDTSGLELTRIYDEPIGVAMSNTHPLAAADHVTVADVVRQPTFDFPTPDVAWRDFWSAAAYRDSGDRPRYVAQYQTLEGLLAALRAGLGVHLATVGLVGSVAAGLVWRRLDDVDSLEHFVARRADDDRPLVREFISSTVDAFAAA
jgi:DNA-binding transcriptional LysR family regulator